MTKLSENLHKVLQQGIHFHQQGLLLEAKAIYEQILKSQPNNFDALDLLATIAAQTKDFDQAINLWERASNINPYDASTYSNRGLAYHALNQFNKALANHDIAVKLNPGFAEAHFNRGNALKELKQYEAAINSYHKAISLKPDFTKVYFNLGNALKEFKQYEAAINSYHKAISLKPEFADAYNNLGLAYYELKKFSHAIDSYNKVLNINPDHSDVHNNLGLAFHGTKQFDAAIACFEKSLNLNPHFPDAAAEAYYNRGLTLSRLNLYDKELASYKRAFQLNSETNHLLGQMIHAKMQLCDWSDINTLTDLLIEKTLKLKKISNPFASLPLLDSPEIHKLIAKLNVDDRCSSNTLPPIYKHPHHQKIRIGYFSADFREHAVSYLTAELFELHNRNKFEIIAFSFGPDTQDSSRKRLENGFDQFIDVKDQTEQEIAALARKMEIDIAVDLGGFTADCRTGIFAMRAAPIQLSYIGYLGTMGADYYDYLIADSTIIPQDCQQYYSEKIVYLPSYQVNDTKREISEKIFTRSELGLPADGFVFCCFNNIYKITPGTFDSWMQILLNVDGSVLFLLDANETATNNLKKEATTRGVSSDRLVFAKPLPAAEYLARYRIADLFLDTLPYNAGTTASDALRMGLPVLTLMGKSFASRMAASLLNAVRLPELITHNQEAYESLAIELATNPQKLDAIKSKLLSNLPSAPLYNTKLFAQHIESAYENIYRRYQDDLNPEHLVITAP